MVVGDAEEECVAGVDREEAERLDASFRRKRLVQLPLERLRERRLPIATGCEDFERAGRAAAMPFLASGAAIELEARQAGMLERLIDRARDGETVERAGDAHGVDGDVRMQLAPVEHRPLEQVQPSGKVLHCRAVQAFNRGPRAPRR